MTVQQEQELEARVQSLQQAMTTDEKLSLLAGKSLFKTRGIPRLALAPMKLSDGPRGVGFHSTFKRCTAFPTGIALAASWDPELGREFGEALALEARSVGAQVVLGPAVNICRTPLNGRTFEYFTEDPELNSRLAVAVIKDIQSNGVAACVKHYAANNQETNRVRNTSRVSERALREIYLPAFEAAVREAAVWQWLGHVPTSGFAVHSTAAVQACGRPTRLPRCRGFATGWGIPAKSSVTPPKPTLLWSLSGWVTGWEGTVRAATARVWRSLLRRTRWFGTP